MHTCIVIREGWVRGCLNKKVTYSTFSQIRPMKDVCYDLTRLPFQLRMCTSHTLIRFIKKSNSTLTHSIVTVDNEKGN